MENQSGSVGRTPATDFLELRPQLRIDLIFRPQRIAGRSVYIVEDPVRTQFYRLGRNEYLLAACFDGQITVREAICRANRSLPEEPLNEHDALCILNWATQCDLLESKTDIESAKPTGSPAADDSRPKRGQNPVCFRLPLGSPDPWMARCYPYLAWIYSRWATAVGLSLIAVGLAALFEGWDRMVASTDDIFSPAGQLSLLICWIVLKAIHELSHGLVCRRYGGTIREAGLVVILFLPIAYVDVTSSWRIRSRWQRIHIAAAGMQLELYVAGLAAILWSLSAPGIFNQICANLVLMAGVTTILFNANPLMRFDGYYLLTDLLEIPNLAVTGQSWLRGWARHFFLGLPTINSSWPNGRAGFIRSYAVAAFLWRIFVSLGLIIAAAAMWHGAGVVVAGVAVVAWIGVPLVRFIELACVRSGPVAPNWRRFATLFAAIAVISTTALACLPWPGARQATGIVDYDPPTDLRTEIDGFVEQVLVRSGQSVVTGQEIAHLRNQQLQRDFAILKIEVEAARVRIRGLRGRRELAQMEAEIQQLAALEKQRTELARQVESLVLRAPVAGRVVSRNVDEKIGLFLRQGDVLLSLGNEDRKQIEFSIPDNELPAFEAALHVPVAVSVETGESYECQVERIQPRATIAPLDRCLCAPFGGELSVRQSSPPVSCQDQEASFELLKPHFTGNIRLDAQQSVRLKSGQRVQVLHRGHRDSLGAHLWELLTDWVLRLGGTKSS